MDSAVKLHFLPLPLCLSTINRCWIAPVGRKKGRYNECTNFLSSDLFSYCKAMVLGVIKIFLAVEGI